MHAFVYCAYVSIMHTCIYYTFTCVHLLQIHIIHMYICYAYVYTYLTIHKYVYLLAYIVYYDTHNVSIPNENSHSFT